jgi:hypothetical protein
MPHLFNGLTRESITTFQQQNHRSKRPLKEFVITPRARIRSRSFCGRQENTMKAKMSEAKPDKKVADKSLAELTIICNNALRARPRRALEEDAALVDRLATVAREALDSVIASSDAVTLLHACAAVTRVALGFALQIDDIVARATGSEGPRRIRSSATRFSDHIRWGDSPPSPRTIAVKALRILPAMMNQLSMEAGGGSVSVRIFMMFQRFTGQGRTIVLNGSKMDRTFLLIQNDFEGAKKEIVARMKAGYSLAVICVAGEKGKFVWDVGPGIDVPRENTRFIDSVIEGYLEASAG